MTASIIINTVIFLTTTILLILRFRKDRRWEIQRGLKAFRYFTVLSNAFCAISALVLLISEMIGSVSPAALLLKYLGIVSVTVTFLTVMLFLGPTQGFKKMLGGQDIYMHLIGPLLAIISFCFLEKREMTLGTAMIGVIPVLTYGLVYLYKVIYAPEDKRWDDFYGFNRGGRWPVSFAAMIGGAAFACVLLWVVGR